MKKALVFVSRCQNLKGEHNDRPWAKLINDGSFIYTPADGGVTKTQDKPGPNGECPRDSVLFKACAMELAKTYKAPRNEYESLARVLKETLQRMNRALEAPPFNLIIHSAPFSESETCDAGWP